MTVRWVCTECDAEGALEVPDTQPILAACRMAFDAHRAGGGDKACFLEAKASVEIRAYLWPSGAPIRFVQGGGD